jgi:predicted thioesterase
MANTARYLKKGGILVVLAIDVRRVKPAPPGVEVCACRSLPSETQEAIEKTGFLLRKMEERYKTLAAEGVRNIEQYNRNIRQAMLERPANLR